DLAQVRRGKLGFFADADEQQALCGKTLREVDQHGFERLAGKLAVLNQLRESSLHCAVDLPQSAFETALVVKNARHQGVGCNRGVWLSIKLDLHVSLSRLRSRPLLTMARAANRFVRFAFCFLAPLRFAAIVKFFTFTDGQFAFCHAVAKINLHWDDSHALLLRRGNEL